MAEEKREESFRQGMQEGILKRGYIILLKLINRRFGTPPDWALQKMKQANTERLEAWSEKILDAQTLITVFD